MIHILTALGLSVDAFLIVLLYSSIHKKYITKLPIVIGVMHIVFPFAACQLTQNYLCEHISFPNIVSFVIFIFLGIQQFFAKEDEPKMIKNLFNIFLLSIGVSVDSALVGISYGLDDSSSLGYIVLLYGLVAFLISYLAIFVSVQAKPYLYQFNLNYISGTFFIILGFVALLGLL